MASNNNVNLEKLEEYDNHHKIVFLNNPKNGLRGFIAIHRKNNSVPSFGATRIWRYENSVDCLKDALRLSKMMSYKAALAGLSCGGAKGVIMEPDSLDNRSRKSLLTSYAREVSNLNGEFITGTDVGLSQKDLKLMSKESKFFVGLNSDATEFTALGILYGIEACFNFLDRKEDISGETFAIQGLGKIGKALLNLLYKKARKIYVSDSDSSVIKSIKGEFPKVIAVKLSEIHKQEVDVFSPCALSHSLNQRNVAELKCSIIAGGANSQLENDNVGALLHRLNILYCPDFVINAGGLIAVVSEYENPDFYHNLVSEKVKEIKNRLNNIFEISKKENRPTNIIANQLAVKIFNNYK